MLSGEIALKNNHYYYYYIYSWTKIIIVFKLFFYITLIKLHEQLMHLIVLFLTVVMMVQSFKI